MKKTILYLSILMSVLITACSTEDMPNLTPQEAKEGKTCEVSFWASIPEAASASRGELGEATDKSVTTLKLLVFDAATSVYLYENNATLSEQTINDNGIHKGKYTANL